LAEHGKLSRCAFEQVALEIAARRLAAALEFNRGPFDHVVDEPLEKFARSAALSSICSRSQPTAELPYSSRAFSWVNGRSIGLPWRSTRYQPAVSAASTSVASASSSSGVILSRPRIASLRRCTARWCFLAISESA